MIDLNERLIRYNEEGFFDKWHLDGTPEQACLGKGSYGSVYSVSTRGTGGTEHAAIKIIAIDESSLPSSITDKQQKQEKLRKKKQEVETEIGVSEKLKGAPNIAYFHDAMIINRKDTELESWDVLIWMNRLTPLKERLKMVGTDQKARLTEALRIWRDISVALKTCERLGIIHADVKPENILFCEDFDYYMLCDFGVAIPEGHFTTQWQGTFPYMSPEMFYQRGGDSRTDMYSLAVVIYEMLSGGAIAVERHKRGQVKQGDLVKQPVQPIKGIPGDVNEALIRCLYEDPGHRYPNMQAVEDVTSQLYNKYRHASGEDRKPLPRKKLLIPAIAAAAVLLVAVIAVIAGGQKKEAPAPAAEAAPTAAPTEESEAVEAMADEEEPEPTPKPTQEPAPAAELGELKVEEQSVTAGTGEVTLHGRVAVEGELAQEDLRVSVNGNRAAAQWEDTEDGLGFTATLNMDLEDTQELKVEVAVIGADSVEPVSISLPVEAPEATAEPAEELFPASEPLVLNGLEQLDGAWFGPESTVAFTGSARPGARVDVNVNDVFFNRLTVAEDGSFAVEIPSGSLAEGDNRISVDYSVESLDGVNYATAFVARYDTGAPEMEAPPTVDQLTQELAVTVRDQDAGCHVSLSVNGNKVMETVVQEDGVARLPGVNALGLTEQSAVVIAAVDGAGNRSEAPITFVRQQAGIAVDALEELSTRVYDPTVAPVINGAAEPNAVLDAQCGDTVNLIPVDGEGRFGWQIDPGLLREGDNGISICYAGAVDPAVSFVLHYTYVVPEPTPAPPVIYTPLDYADILSPEAEAQVATYNEALVANCGGAQIIVRTEFYQGLEPEAYSAMFSEVVGSVEQSNCMFLLFLPDSAEAYLMLGGALPGTFAEGEVDQYLNDYFWPSATGGDFNAAVLTLTGKLYEWYLGHCGLLQLPGDLWSLPLEEAQGRLQAMGLNVIISLVQSPDVAPNCAVGTDPGAGAIVPVGSTVTLAVSAGPEPAYTAMPQVVGMTREEARLTLEGVGLVLTDGGVSYSESLPEEADRVLWQQIEAGTQLVIGTQVVIGVGSGPAAGA